jgi:2'-5' RNA ligase
MYYALNDALAPYAEKEERRTFSPHITLGRVNSSRRREELRQLIESNLDVQIGMQSVEEITVMMSELTRGGPLYTPLSKSPLGE